MFALFKGLMAFLLIVTSCFMILLILVQRGRGGGITGALGGAGGQSAFGSKAGDVFTRITIGTAVVWIVLAMMTISIFNPPRPDILDSADSGMRAVGEQTQPTDEQAAQPGVSETEAGQLPGETPKVPGETPKVPGETPKDGAAQPSDPGLNAPAASAPDTPPAGNPPGGSVGGQAAPSAETGSGDKGGQQQDQTGSGG